MLRLILSSHERICIPPECGFALWLYRDYEFWTYEDGFENFIFEVVGTRKFETWGLEANDLRRVMTDVRPDDYAGLVDCVYQAYLEKVGKVGARWGDKNNFYVNHLEDLKTLYPSVSIVFIVRDPRDVFCSYRELMGKNIDGNYAPKLSTKINEFCGEWLEMDSKLELAKKLFGNKLHIVRYEDLVSSPQDHVGGICEFLGLNFEKSMFSFYENNDEPESFLDWKSRTFGPIDLKSVGRYRKSLEVGEIEMITAKLNHFLVDHGYLGSKSR